MIFWPQSHDFIFSQKYFYRQIMIFKYFFEEMKSWRKVNPLIPSFYFFPVLITHFLVLIMTCKMNEYKFKISHLYIFQAIEISSTPT